MDEEKTMETQTRPGFMRDNNRAHINLDAATNGHCPEGLGDLYAGYIECGVLYLVGSVAEHYYRAHRELVENEPAQDTEDVIRNRLAARLKKCGWIVEKESHTSQGRIDIFARRGDEERIIEVKLGNTSHVMAHALGQLLFYSKFHPDASLWIYTPEKPDTTILSILKSYNVRFMEIAQ